VGGKFGSGIAVNEIALTAHVTPQLHPPGPIAPAPPNAFGAALLGFVRFAAPAPTRQGVRIPRRGGL
jgi:hypothetical protein